MRTDAAVAARADELLRRNHAPAVIRDETGLSLATIYRMIARRRKTAAAMPAASSRLHVAPASPSAPVAKEEPVATAQTGATTYGPPLPKEQLEQLCRVAAFLPLEQQDVVLARLPLDRIRREAIARAIARFPDAGQAVAHEFAIVEASLR